MRNRNETSQTQIFDIDYCHNFHISGMWERKEFEQSRGAVK